MPFPLKEACKKKVHALPYPLKVVHKKKVHVMWFAWKEACKESIVVSLEQGSYNYYKFM